MFKYYEQISADTETALIETLTRIILRRLLF